jgi:predicted nucleotidyltransferase
MLGVFAPFRVLSFLLGNPSGFSVRGVARGAGVSPSTAKYCLDFFEVKGLVSRRVIGRSHIFSLVNESLLLRQIKKTLVLDMIRGSGLLDDVADDCPGVSSIVLFGSAARGENAPDSDLDFLIISSVKVDVNFMQKFFDIDVNLLSYTPGEWHKKALSDRPFYHRILTEGMVLYGEVPIVT